MRLFLFKALCLFLVACLTLAIGGACALANNYADPDIGRGLQPAVACVFCCVATLMICLLLRLAYLAHEESEARANHTDGYTAYVEQARRDLDHLLAERRSTF